MSISKTGFESYNICFSFFIHFFYTFTLKYCFYIYLKSFIYNQEEIYKREHVNILFRNNQKGLVEKNI